MLNTRKINHIGVLVLFFSSHFFLNSTDVCALKKQIHSEAVAVDI